jgi:hypothetical protein
MLGSGDCDAWKGRSCGWRRRRIDGGGIFALRIGLDANWVACLPRLLVDFFATQKLCDDPVLSLGHLVGVSLTVCWKMSYLINMLVRFLRFV